MIVLFGGTFDPVHNGHLHAARAVASALDSDEIRMVLSARPGHRTDPAAGVKDRWQMLKLACQTDDRLVPDDLEVRRRTPSYTVDTLRALRARHFRETLVWVLGNDQYTSLPSWCRWRDVLGLCNLLVLMRPGEPGEPAEHKGELAKLTRDSLTDSTFTRIAGQVRRLETPMLDVSGTEIRAAVAAGKAVAHLLPEGVYTYIRSHGLYGVTSEP